MNKTNILLNEIKKRPGLYLGKKSLELLKAYMDGYIYGINECKENKDYGFFVEFQKFIESKYPISKTHSWADLIVFYSSSDEEAFDRFFELYDEFQQQKLGYEH